MTGVTGKDYQNAATDALSMQGQDPSKMTTEQQAQLAKDIATMAQYESSIGNAATNNPNADPNYVLSQLSSLSGKDLDANMILNLAAGRPALWQPVPPGSAGLGGTSPNDIAAWTSSPFVSFLLSCQDLAMSLRDQDVQLATLDAYMNKVQTQVGKDIATTKKEIKTNEANMYHDMMVASIVTGVVSVTMSVASFGLSLKAATFKAGTSSGNDKANFQRWSAAAQLSSGLADSVNKFGQAGESGIRAKYTLQQGALEQTEQLLNTLMQILGKTQDTIKQADQDTRQNFAELLRMMQDAVAQMMRNTGIGVRG